MALMIFKMSSITVLYVLLTAIIWKVTNDNPLSKNKKIFIGLIFGLCSVLSTHFGVDYQHMLLNVRDLGPLMAGLFFDPVSGIIAGIIGGVERYIAGTYWNIGSYTRIACSISTCLAGFVSAGLNIFVFKSRKPSATFAFFMGAVMEAFHMYVVFITHRGDMDMAFYVVRTCAPGMIIFSGIGLCAASLLLQYMSGEWSNPFQQRKEEDIPIARRFEVWLFVVTASVLLVNLLFAFNLETAAALQQSDRMLTSLIGDMEVSFLQNGRLSYQHVGKSGSFDIFTNNGTIKTGVHPGTKLSKSELHNILSQPEEVCFQTTLFGEESMCCYTPLIKDMSLLVCLPMSEVYKDRDAQTYETGLADIIVFAVIYILVSTLVQKIVVNNLLLVNASLQRITNGNLNEKVEVRKSSEYASLSDDINQMVTALKGYIAEAEKRFERDLMLAKNIQESALPRNFDLHRSEFEIYATMDPAKEVGGDFYDFFFVEQDKLALVIADVSGKGIPASLFMMRAKTTIRGLAAAGNSPSEIFYQANNTLCDGNDAEMFVTAWIGILDLTNGHMVCANAGHEYPVLMKAGGSYNLFRNKHSAALATIEELPYREYEMNLNPEDRLFVYTDGIPEAIDSEIAEYGTDRLVDILNKTRTSSMKDTLVTVREDISRFVGDAEQFDDITMLGICYRP